MCGIVGLFNMKKTEDATFSETNKAFLIKYLLTELTIETQPRGRDATGYCALFQNGETIGLKHGIKASEFCTKNWNKKEFNFTNHLKLIEAYHNEISPVASVLAHCRAKTVGSETNNDNNHPIYVKDVIGIHNGCLSNHTKIFEHIKEDIIRIGDVDSEMIFQLIWLELKKGKLKFCDNVIKGVTEKLDGSFAVICINKKDPDSILFFRDTRPIEFIYIKEAGFLIALSEKKFFVNAAKNYDWLKFYGADLPSFTYESYTLPDDKAFILDLNVKIKKNDSIKAVINPITTIERTHSDWKTYAYAGYNKVTTRQQLYQDDDRDFPYSMHNRNQTPAVINQDEKKKDNDDKAVKSPVETATTVRKIETKETDVDTNIEVASWNEKNMDFDFITENFDDIYIKSQKLLTDKYTIYKNCKTLAGKLDIPVDTLTSYTLPQIANRVSKIIYDEYVESKINELKIATKKIEKLESKSDKAREHILALRGIINLLIGILVQAKNIEYPKLKLSKLEKRVLGKTWAFLYSNKKTSIENTALGKFIYNLGHKDNEQTTGKTN
jgi:hypothetical protein